jgi:hypothetical protein
MCALPLAFGSRLRRQLMTHSGHRLVRCKCPLLTHSGHVTPPNGGLSYGVSPPNPGLRPCNRIATGRDIHGIPRRLYMRRMSLGVFYFASVALGEGC